MAANTGVINVPWQRLGDRFDRQFPSISRPECIGVCTIDARRDYVDDASGASYLVAPPWPPLPFDLNAGIADVIRKSTDSATKDLEFALIYIQHHKKQLLRPQKSDPGSLGLDIDFVTLRGILRQIILTPQPHLEAHTHGLGAVVLRYGGV